MIEDLIEQIAPAIEQLITEQGFEAPLYLASIAANGSIAALHYHWTDPAQPEEGLDADLVADHTVGPGCQFPINIIYRRNRRACCPNGGKPERQPLAALTSW